MRDGLQARQTEFLRALLLGAPAPEGMDERRVRIQARCLHYKRMRETGQGWPFLRQELGDEWEPLFTRYAAGHLRPPGGNPVADGYRFAVWLRSERPEFLKPVQMVMFWHESSPGVVKPRRGVLAWLLRLRARLSR